MTDLWDHEGNARAIYAEAGIDPSAPLGAHALAWALCGARCIRYDWRPLFGDGCYEPPRGGRRETIWIRPKLTPEREAWVIFHELAERHLYEDHHHEEHERACNELAARLRAPREAFLPLVREVGFDPPRLARAVRCSQTSAVLRFSEATGTPLALVSARSVRYRGEEWGWPPEPELRRLARARTLPAEIRRVAITDAPRSAIVAA